MARELDVYLHDEVVGTLLQDEHGQMLFTYGADWLSNSAAIPLSQSLPLRPAQFDQNECRPFFAGILPEAVPREIVAHNLGISSKNDFEMLREIGGECAGAITFLPAGQPKLPQDSGYRSLTAGELARVLRDLPKRPLLAGDEGIRISLAGAQNKLAVHVSNGDISIPIGAALSTHILKPPIGYIDASVFNEAFCMTLARRVGLPTAQVQLRRIEGVDYLLVKRYDRAELPATDSSPAETVRLHQEDFCQALGNPPGRKYQNEGGPTLAQCANLIRSVSSAPVLDLPALLDAAIFNFLIGNNDAHGKNFSLLYETAPHLEPRTQLAPFYDLLSTEYYPDLSKKMAMKLGGEYLFAKVLPRHFERLADEAGYSKPQVRRRVPDLAHAIVGRLDEVVDLVPNAKPIADFVRDRCDRTIRRFS